MTCKPVVRYRGQASVFAHCAFLIPTDHPNHLDGHSVSNINVVKTSRVLAHDPSTGLIETANTIYMPEQQKEAS